MSDRNPDLEHAVELGNEMAEGLETLIGDPVVVAYRKRMDDMTRSLWVEAAKEPPERELLERWDALVGKLQREDAIDTPSGEVDVAIESVPQLDQGGPDGDESGAAPTGD